MKAMTRFAAMIVVAALCMGAQETTRKFVPVTDAMLQKPDPANWLMWRRTLDSWGYSPLNQINRTNVAQLRLTWTRGLGPGNTQEATPLVYDGVMYIPNPGDYFLTSIDPLKEVITGAGFQLVVAREEADEDVRV